MLGLLASTIAGIGWSPAAQAAFQTSGLIANWIPSGLSSGSSTWSDAVNSTSLSLSNTTYTGSNGGYLGFNGTSSNAHATGLNSTPGATMSMFFWINVPDLTAQRVIENVARTPSSTVNEQQFNITTSGTFNYWDYDGTNMGFSGNSTGAITANTWNYVGFVKKPTGGTNASLTFYINGASAGTITTTNSVAVGSSDFTLGYDYRDHVNYYSGKIGQASVWSAELSAANVASNYAATNGNYISPSITSSSSSQSIYLTQSLNSVTETNTGGTATYSISPTLPNGLSIDPNNGTISGTPTVASPYTSYTVTATNIAGTATLTFNLTVTQAGVVLTGPATISYRQAATIQATPNGATTLAFFANGKRIPACVRIVSSGSMVTCSFKPALQGPNSVYATFSISGITGRSNTINIRATPRGTTR